MAKKIISPYKNPIMVKYKGELITRGERAIRWIEDNLHVPEGILVGKRIKLQKFQKDFLRRVYDNPDRTRRAIVSFGRKNGKTALAAMLLLLHLVGPEAVQNSQLYSAARSAKQAAIIFDLAAKMVMLSDTIKPWVNIVFGAKIMRCPRYGTVFQSLSKNAITALGLSPVFVIHDELGAVKGPRDDLYDALETASGAQESPMTFIISTQAAADQDLLSILIDDARNSNDPKTVLSIHEAPMDADPFIEETIKLANPAYGIFQNAEETLGMAADAKRMPSAEAKFRNLILNQRVETHSPFITKSLWDGAASISNLDWKGKDVYAGLDLSLTGDLSALSLLWQVDEMWYTDTMFWLPEQGLKEKAKEERVPYDIWKNNKFLNTTPGATIDYDFIAAKLNTMRNECNFQRIAFDDWGWNVFKKSLESAEFKESWIDSVFFKFSQAAKYISPAMAVLEGMLLNGLIKHSNNPLQNWCMSNAVVIEDHNEHRKIVKKAEARKIDGAVALVMASGVMMETPVKKKAYKGTGIPLIL